MTAVLHAPARTDAEAPPHRACPECLTDFVAVQDGQLFCTPAHRVAWNNRWTVRGRRWAILAAVARLTRNGTRDDHPFAARASRDADTLLRQWRAEDARAGRMDVLAFNHLRYAAGFDPL